MINQRLRLWRATITVLAFAALAGCQSQTAKEAAQSVSDGASSAMGTIRGWFIPERIEPLVNSVEQEYCILPKVVSAYGSGELGPAVAHLSAIHERSLSKEERAESLFCKQNLGGVVLITDRVMNLALGEIQSGVEIASEALDIKIKGQQAMLARIARMKNLSIGQKLDPEYAKDLDRLNDDVSRLQEATEKRLEALTESGGITKDVQVKLEQAHKHFVNFRHYQGKALSGIAIFDAARKTYGPGVVYQAFVEAVQIDRRNRKRKTKEFPATEKLAKAFVVALPKFTETMFSGERISTAIWKAADKADFENALEAINEPPAEKTEELVTYASDVNASTSSLGLPSASGAKG
ncbi:MAG: hypothetical protein MJE12_05910 [Alphaproteobacteria bacterium]|nr:hypothetical protein [Alphaproteobacteria bacterium]